MRPLRKNLPQRAAEKARAAAAGSPVPAGQEQPAPEAAAIPGSGQRAAMRRRARRLRRTREVQLRELGALVVEMRRLGRDNPELVARKTAEATAVDEELRGLRTALGERQTVEHVVAAGVSGSCARCGTLLGTDDRFCPQCGRPVAERADGAAAAGAAPAEPAAAEPAAVAAAVPPPPPPPPAPPAEPPAPELTATSPPQP
jgi:hypothetical protein